MTLAGTRATTPSLSLAPLAKWLAALSGWKQALASFGLGAFSVLTLAPFHIWPLAFVTLTGFVWVLDGISQTSDAARRSRIRRAALAGWWFGFGYFLAGLYWIGFAFFVEADKFAWLMPFAVVAMPAGLALFYAAATGAAMAFWQGGVRRIFIFAALMFAAEWLRGHILTGFPWNLWGYALAGNDALAQSASLFGIFGLTLLAFLIFASPAALAGLSRNEETQAWLLPVLFAAVLAGGWIWGTLRLERAAVAFHPGMTLRIVQGNIPQKEKNKPENRYWIFERLLALSRNGPASSTSEAIGTAAQATKITHLIWPETSVPVLFGLNDGIAFKDVRDIFATLIGDGGTIIVGAERVEGTKLPDNRYRIDREFNSLFVLDNSARILGIYDKTHLVPFGEYIPFAQTLARAGIRQLAHPSTGFASGTSRRLIHAPHTPPFSPLICYEAIFPGRVAGDDGRPEWLLNLTNDAWFGTSTGPYQHLHQARLRAIEEGLPLVRAANTGVSAVVDPYGRVIAKLPLNTMGAIDTRLPISLNATSFSSWGEISLMVVAFLTYLLYRVIIKVV